MITVTDLVKRAPARFVSTALTLGVGVSMLASAPAALAAPASATSTAVTTHAVSVDQQRAAASFWTPQRRAAATPADVVGVAPAKAQQNVPVVPHGTPSQVAGSGAGGAAAAVANPLSPTIATAYPFPYSSFNVSVANYTKFPWRLNGKIFFTNNGVSYVCSGTSVASYHGTSIEDEVWTAGHCVSNTNLSSPGVFDSFAEFIPAYNGNSKNYAPYGIFYATRYSVATNFLNNGDISVDEGAFEVGTNAAGQTLGQAVGWDGFAWNYPTAQKFFAFGYPQASPYTGNKMVEDIAKTAASVSWSGGAGQPLIGIGNPMTGGSSGGAWDIGWTTSDPGYINGHNDYKFYSQPNAMYSPYQDTLSNTVRCFGASSC